MCSIQYSYSRWPKVLINSRKFGIILTTSCKINKNGKTKYKKKEELLIPCTTLPHMCRK